MNYFHVWTLLATLHIKVYLYFQFVKKVLSMLKITQQIEFCITKQEGNFASLNKREILHH